jgi:hypothetical protein
MKALPAPDRPYRIPKGKRETVHWATKELPAHDADEGFYRICGVKGSGKSHLTKLFILDALREVESNPHAKLIVYEPKREFYSWIRSLNPKSTINYFMPSDRRSVALSFTKDYWTDQDSFTLALAFYPYDPNERQRFWGDSLRTIYASVHMAIKKRLGRVDLRLMCLVIEEESYTRQILGYDPYLVQARKLLEDHGDAIGDTKQNILMTIHSRIAEMKVIAAHMDRARRKNGTFSIVDFVKKPNSGIFVVSKDSRFRTTQDPMNGVLFLRLVDILDSQQRDPRRKVFVVIDEFPTLAGDNPCPGITDMFLRLRSRGVTVFLTYQAHTTLKRIYGPEATEHIGQCTNIIYLRQADVESAQYAESDLGRVEGTEQMPSTSFGAGGWSIGQSTQKSERPRFTYTYLKNDMKKASPLTGIQGVAMSPEHSEGTWPFVYSPRQIDAIPRTDHEAFPEYERRGKKSQRLRPLTEREKKALGLVDKPPPNNQAKRKPNYPPTV